MLQRLRAFTMLGTFGLILLVSIAIVGAVVSMQINTQSLFAEVYTVIQNRLNYQVTASNFLDSQAQSRRVLIAHFYPSTGEDLDTHLVYYEDLLAYTDEILDTIDDSAVYEDEVANAALLRDQRDVMQVVFEDTLTALDEDSPIDFVNAVADTEIQINQDIRHLITETSTILNLFVDDLNAQRDTAMWIGVVAMVIFPLLAIVAFISASQFTQPLLMIDNAITALGGGTPHHSFITPLLKRPDGLGHLARAVNTMAQAVQARDAELEQEVAALRTQWAAERRRKLASSVSIRDTITDASTEG